jgi:putative transposase
MLRYIWFVFYSFFLLREYKEELVKSQKQNERLTTLVGKVTVEKEWLAKKLKSLGLFNCKQLVEFKLSKPL